MNPNLIAVVDDDSSVRRVLKMQLEEAGYRVVIAATVAEARDILAADNPRLVITDLKMPGEGGLDLLRHIREEHGDTTVIIITAFGSVETAVEAMKAGAYDYVTKPIDNEALLLAVHRAMERQALLEEVRNLRAAVDQRTASKTLSATLKSLLRVLEMAARVARHDSTVLIRGETGTGKELLARAIHHNSRRCNRSFVAINCGAIPQGPHRKRALRPVRGAFTGAHARQTRPVEMADGGTLFLDEVGELPLEMQAKILRVLQERRDREDRQPLSRHASTSASSPPPTATFRPWWRTGPSARISTTGWP